MRIVTKVSSEFPAWQNYSKQLETFHLRSLADPFARLTHFAQAAGKKEHKRA